MLHPQAEAFAPRLTHEMRMFFVPRRDFSTPVDSLEYEIYLDSFLVHYRMLFSFFQVKAHDQDCVAEHFIAGDADWKTIRKELFQRSLDERQRAMGRLRLEKVQQHLAYLNYDQIFRETDWPIADIIADVYEAWDTFLGALDRDQRSWFPDDELPEITGCKEAVCNIAP